MGAHARAQRVTSALSLASSTDRQMWRRFYQTRLSNLLFNKLQPSWLLNLNQTARSLLKSSWEYSLSLWQSKAKFDCDSWWLTMHFVQQDKLASLSDIHALFVQQVGLLHSQTDECVDKSSSQIQNWQSIFRERGRACTPREGTVKWRLLDSDFPVTV